MSEKQLAQCHCGTIKFTVELIEEFSTIRRCNCYFCRMRGAVAISASLSGIDVYQGKDKLTEYRFNTRQAVHYFCSVCGIYTFHQRRSNPEQFAVNVACILNISPFDFAKIPILDGINHPKDGGGGIVGDLTYEARVKILK